MATKTITVAIGSTEDVEVRNEFGIVIARISVGNAGALINVGTFTGEGSRLGGCQWAPAKPQAKPDAPTAETHPENVTRVFLNMKAVTRKGTPCYVASWISRNSGSEMYTSKACDTREAAEALARKWIARDAWCRELPAK